MERRRKRRGTASRVLKQIKLVWIVKGLLYGLGIYCFFYSEREQSITLISISTPVIIGVILGIIASIILERDYKYYLFSIIFFGSIFTAAFFKLNRFFASNTEVKLKQHILYKVLASPKMEYSRVTIVYDDYNKDIAIAKDQEPLLESAAFVVLTVRKGIFGYYIITDRELAKN